MIDPETSGPSAGDDGAGPDSDETPAGQNPSLSQSFAAAARKSGLGKLDPDEAPTAGALLGAIGGVRGIVESTVPGFVFLVVFTITHQVLPSVIGPVVIAVIFVIARAVTRSPLTQAVAGAIGIALTAAIALLTGRAENNFLPGIYINVSVLVILLVSLAVRWPLIGVALGMALDGDSSWRSNDAKRRAFTIATWVWVIPSAIRVAVQIPLYLARNAEALAATKIITGIPLYVGTLWITWLLVRAVYARSQPE